MICTICGCGQIYQSKSFGALMFFLYFQFWFSPFHCLSVISEGETRDSQDYCHSPMQIEEEKMTKCFNTFKIWNKNLTILSANRKCFRLNYCYLKQLLIRTDKEMWLKMFMQDDWSKNAEKWKQDATTKMAW